MYCVSNAKPFKNILVYSLQSTCIISTACIVFRVQNFSRMVLVHHTNTPISLMPPYIPLSYSRFEVYKGIQFFFLFLL